MGTNQYKKRKILFISSFTLPDTAGSGIHAFRFARFINRKEDTASILTFNRNLRLRSFEKIDGVKINRIPYFNRGVLLKLLSFPLVLTWYIFHILKNNVIIIYGGRTYAFEIAILIGWLLKKKVIFRSLLYGVDDLDTLTSERSKLGQAINKRLNKMISLYYSINSLITESYLKNSHNNNKLFEMPQGIDLEYFNISNEDLKIKYRSDLKLPDDKIIILSVGFLIERKGYRQIFLALKNLSVPFKYIIIGEYNFNKTHFLSSNQMEAQEIQMLGKSILGDNIVFLGPELAVNMYMRAADIFIHNAILEIPNVVYEAMACGLPVIAKRIEGEKENILKHNQNCLLSDTGNSLQELINLLIINPSFRYELGMQANETIITKANFDIIYNELLSQLGVNN